MRIRLAPAFALFFITASHVAPGTSVMNNSEPLQISIERGSGPKQLRIVLANGSAAPIRIWKEQCSLGYEAFSLEVKSGAEASRIIKPKPISWRRNLPQYRILKAGEKYAVDFSSDDWPGLLTQGKQGLEIRAHYTVAQDEDAVRDGVWTGHIQSEWAELKLYATR